MKTIRHHPALKDQPVIIPGPHNSGSTRTDSNPDTDSRIIIVDGHHLARFGLRYLLQQWRPRLQVIRESAGREPIAQLCRQLQPDIIVTELYMPGDTVRGEARGCLPAGLEACREIKALPRPPAVLIYSTCTSESVIAECALSGVDGYVHKATNTDYLLEGLHNLVSAQPGPWGYPEGVNPDLVAAIMEDKARLTPSRRRVYDLALHGVTQGEMARLLHTSVDSIKSSRREIGRKLSANWDSLLYP